MTDHTVTHSTFTLERSYPVPPATAFHAWSDAETKHKWFAAGDTNGEYSMDFQVDGREVAVGDHEGTRLTFTTTYADIVADERIVYSSTMYFGDTLATLTLTSVEFEDVDGHTKLTLTEHGAYLDGQEKPEWREQGTSEQLDALAKVLAG